MANGILGMIANPAQADALGAVKAGKEDAANDMAGDILGQTLGGKIGGLAKISPDKGLALANALGIPTNSKGRMEAMIGNTVMASKLLQVGMFEEAAQLFEGQAKIVESLTGQDATRYRLGAEGFRARDPEMIKNVINTGVVFDPQRQKKTGMASAKTEILDDGSVIQSMPDGTTQVRDPSGNIVTGQKRLEVLKAASEAGINKKQIVADIAVEQAQQTAMATQRASRVSEITKDLSERNRNASREQVKLNQAFKIAGMADQGLTGTAKIQLAKLFPSIDVTNEAMLEQSLKGLALDQLQNFKGPTTDFEFGVTEDIAGKLGDPKTANVSRIKSLQRANWFNKREFMQFQKWVDSGKNPDTFGFDFGERISTKKGDFSLQDLQDTAVENNMTIDEVIKLLDK